jgi:hypothetical protein
MAGIYRIIKSIASAEMPNKPGFLLKLSKSAMIGFRYSKNRGGNQPRGRA